MKSHDFNHLFTEQCFVKITANSEERIIKDYSNLTTNSLKALFSKSSEGSKVVGVLTESLDKFVGYLKAKQYSKTTITQFEKLKARIESWNDLFSNEDDEQEDNFEEILAFFTSNSLHHLLTIIQRILKNETNLASDDAIRFMITDTIALPPSQCSTGIIPKLYHAFCMTAPSTVTKVKSRIRTYVEQIITLNLVKLKRTLPKNDPTLMKLSTMVMENHIINYIINHFFSDIMGFSKNYDEKEAAFKPHEAELLNQLGERSLQQCRTEFTPEELIGVIVHAQDSEFSLDTLKSMNAPYTRGGVSPYEIITRNFNSWGTDDTFVPERIYNVIEVTDENLSMVHADGAKLSPGETYYQIKATYIQELTVTLFERLANKGYFDKSSKYTIPLTTNISFNRIPGHPLLSSITYKDEQGNDAIESLTAFFYKKLQQADFITIKLIIQNLTLGEFNLLFHQLIEVQKIFNRYILLPDSIEKNWNYFIATLEETYKLDELASFCIHLLDKNHDFHYMISLLSLYKTFDKKIYFLQRITQYGEHPERLKKCLEKSNGHYLYELCNHLMKSEGFNEDQPFFSRLSSKCLHADDIFDLIIRDKSEANPFWQFASAVRHGRIIDHIKIFEFLLNQYHKHSCDNAYGIADAYYNPLSFTAKSTKLVTLKHPTLTPPSENQNDSKMKFTNSLNLNSNNNNNAHDPARDSAFPGIYKFACDYQSCIKLPKTLTTPSIATKIPVDLIYKQVVNYIMQLILVDNILDADTYELKDDSWVTVTNKSTNGTFLNNLKRVFAQNIQNPECLLILSLSLIKELENLNEWYNDSMKYVINSEKKIKFINILIDALQLQSFSNVSTTLDCTYAIFILNDLIRHQTDLSKHFAGNVLTKSVLKGLIANQFTHLALILQLCDLDMRIRIVKTLCSDLEKGEQSYDYLKTLITQYNDYTVFAHLMSGESNEQLVKYITNIDYEANYTNYCMDLMQNGKDSKTYISFESNSLPDRTNTDDMELDSSDDYHKMLFDVLNDNYPLVSQLITPGNFERFIKELPTYALRKQFCHLCFEMTKKVKPAMHHYLLTQLTHPSTLSIFNTFLSSEERKAFCTYCLAYLKTTYPMVHALHFELDSTAFDLDHIPEDTDEQLIENYDVPIDTDEDQEIFFRDYYEKTQLDQLTATKSDCVKVDSAFANLVNALPTYREKQCYYQHLLETLLSQPSNPYLVTQLLHWPDFISFVVRSAGDRYFQQFIDMVINLSNPHNLTNKNFILCLSNLNFFRSLTRCPDAKKQEIYDNIYQLVLTKAIEQHSILMQLTHPSIFTLFLQNLTDEKRQHFCNLCFSKATAPTTVINLFNAAPNMNRDTVNTNTRLLAQLVHPVNFVYFMKELNQETHVFIYRQLTQVLHPQNFTGFIQQLTNDEMKKQFCHFCIDFQRRYPLDENLASYLMIPDNCQFFIEQLKKGNERKAFCDTIVNMIYKKQPFNILLIANITAPKLFHYFDKNLPNDERMHALCDFCIDYIEQKNNKYEYIIKQMTDIGNYPIFMKLLSSDAKRQKFCDECIAFLRTNHPGISLDSILKQYPEETPYLEFLSQAIDKVIFKVPYPKALKR